MADDRKPAPAPLQALGLLVRSERQKRGLTQQRAARRAGVSRKQWALLEKGQNVSAVFLQKVAPSLDLRVLPLGADLEATTRGGGMDLRPLIELAEELASIVERIQAYVLEAALPPSERTHDAAAIADFVAGRDPLPPEAFRHLSRAIQQLTADVLREPIEAPSSRRQSSRRRKREA